MVSPSSWSVDFSVTMKSSCWVIFRQWFTFEKYITLFSLFFFPSFNATSMKLNNVSLFALLGNVAYLLEVSYQNFLRCIADYYHEKALKHF